VIFCLQYGRKILFFLLSCNSCLKCKNFQILSLCKWVNFFVEMNMFSSQMMILFFVLQATHFYFCHMSSSSFLHLSWRLAQKESEISHEKKREWKWERAFFFVPPFCCCWCCYTNQIFNFPLTERVFNEREGKGSGLVGLERSQGKK